MNQKGAYPSLFAIRLCRLHWAGRIAGARLVAEFLRLVDALTRVVSLDRIWHQAVHQTVLTDSTAQGFAFAIGFGQAIILYSSTIAIKPIIMHVFA